MLWDDSVKIWARFLEDVGMIWEDLGKILGWFYDDFMKISVYFDTFSAFLGVYNR